MCTLWRNLSRVNTIKSSFYLDDTTRILIPTNMVRTSYLGKLRTRKQSTNRAVPERRTKRCSPRFRPSDRFCELSFRYLSPGSEGEKCRPLNHRWQIPFIHSTQITLSSNFLYIWQCSSFYFHLVLVSASWHGACAVAETFISEPLIMSCFVPYGTFWCILAQNRWHLRMRICWTNEIVYYLMSPY